MLKFVKKIFSKSSTPCEANYMVDIGSTEKNCPYCGIALTKFPGRKTECKACQNYIYVRTRPSDEQRILVKESELVRVEELWAIKNGTHEDFLYERKKYDDEKEFLRRKLNREPTDLDIQLSLLQKQLPVHAENGDWGLYRNSKMSIAKLFFKTEKYEAALKEYLEVQFIDLNGPNNAIRMNGVPLKGYPAFAPDSAFIAPGIVYEIERTLKKLNRDVASIEDEFISYNEILRKALKLPLSAKTAWEKLKRDCEW
ncbi:MAG: hypothetical protein WA277_10285 [Nitrospirota bacterium]